jgi:hypothetical protein
MIANTITSTITPDTLAQARAAWITVQAPADFEAAVAALPPRVSASGWAARWAAAAAVALTQARRWATFAANEAAYQVDSATPHWGVVKKFGCHSFSALYSYEVQRGEGQMTRPEALAAAEAAKAADPRYREGAEFWDAMMS